MSESTTTEDSWFDLLPWDSERFGFEVARVRAWVPPEKLAGVVDQMRQRGVVLAYYGIADERPALTDQDAARIGARLVDTRIVFRKELELRAPSELLGNEAASRRGIGESSEAFEIRSFREQEVGPELIELARSAGRFSRFRVDARIEPRVFHAIYDAWLIRSVRREIADEVFVGSVGASDVGLVTVAATPPSATIGLLSISGTARGRGYGRAMAEHAFEWAALRGCQALRVATQLANGPACALYAAVGCSVESQERTYHIWIT